MQLLRDVPFTALFWSITEPVRRHLAPPEHHLSPAEVIRANMLAAGGAGAIAAAITTPFDVIKTEQQIAQRSSSLWATAQRIWSRRGVAGFFAGVWPRTVRAAPASAIVVSTYELLKTELSESRLR